MNDTEIEREIQAKGLTAARVTPQDVEDAIEFEFAFTAEEGVIGSNVQRDGAAHQIPCAQLKLLTICVLVLKNGFTVTGQSACASAANFDAELGRKIAREDAKRKIWPLMGYALREQLKRLGC
ncbi:MAG TPA: Gp49 family protein [Burkholderiales bacterium]|nr:Gp49 family protein [Burkholderiales bacterium]